MRKAYYTKESKEEVIIKQPFTSNKESGVKLVNDRTNRKGRDKGVEQTELNTPFAMIRKMLKMTRKEFAEACNVHIRTAFYIDTGKQYPTPLVAKRMQEVARRQGLAVTLDEIYQNLILDFDQLLNHIGEVDKKGKLKYDFRTKYKKPSTVPSTINHESDSPVDPAD